MFHLLIILPPQFENLFIKIRVTDQSLVAKVLYEFQHWLEFQSFIYSRKGRLVCVLFELVLVRTTRHLVSIDFLFVKQVI